ncbi:MAG: fused MFS/spermidine synthase, partial [Flavobacteriales bacterium]|nr:fused MFS/spermidine synthase [Flavobacteriales bacterium]
MLSKISKKYLILAFVEGFAVMAVEMFSVRIISPFYGSSHTLWTSVLASTLFALAIGYFAGGYLAKGKDEPNRILLHLLLVASLFIVGMTFYSNYLMLFFYDYGFLSAVILSPLTILIFPLMFLGCTSPIIIKASSVNENLTGKVSGIIFTISTMGGILASFLFGLIIIPNFGVAIPATVLAVFVSTTALILLYKSERIVILIPFIVGLLGISLYVVRENVRPKLYGAHEVEMVAEGVLGQIKVVKTRFFDGNDKKRMVVNNVAQTNCAMIDGEAVSYWSYPHLISIFGSVIDEGSDALVLGFGSGSNVSELQKRNFKIDAVDLDKRLLQIAKDHFNFKEDKHNFIVDDARHYVQVTDKKYDLIVMDVLKGEVQPNYMLSIESFMALKNVMKEN